jgi:AmmeMemoRadiSam system protein B
MGVWVVDGLFRQRVFLLGPSHHHFTRKCALSTASVYKTPLGDLPIDHEGTSLLRHLLETYTVAMRP